MNDLERTLEAVVDAVSGARTAALIALDGMPVATAGDTGDLSLDVLAASYADLVRRAARCAQDCGMAGADDLVVSGPGGTVVVRAITPDYALLAVLAAGGSLGRARYELHKAALALHGELVG